jgi:hypothetical protein
MNDDKAGPLWLLLESLFESLGFWGRIAVLVVFILAFLALLALITRRKSDR